MKNAHRQDSGQCCVCACTVDNLLTHKAEHALKTCRDTTLRLFWFQHDQILTGCARKTDTVLTALFHLLAVPCSNEVLPYRKSAGHWRRNRSDQMKWQRDSDWRVNMWQLWSFRESSVLIPDGGKRKRRKYLQYLHPSLLALQWSQHAANTVFPSYSSSPNILCEQIILLDMLAYLVSVFTLTMTPLCHLHTHSHPLSPFHRLQSEQSQPPTGCKL